MKIKKGNSSLLQSIAAISTLLFPARSSNCLEELENNGFNDSSDSKQRILQNSACRSIDLSIGEEMDRFRSVCKKCDICAADCAFLRHYGPPSTLVEKFNFSRTDHQKIAFECSLCGLCAAICPEKLNFAELFLLVRRKAVLEKSIDLTRYSTILNYEKLGSSRLFSFYALPDACDAVYFPGCTFPGTRPEITLKIFRYLQSRIPRLGVVLDCCAKPSHDLGRQACFEDAFGKIVRKLRDACINKIIVNCPNCHETFKNYGKGFALSTVYEWIHETKFSRRFPLSGEKVTVHDPCVFRNEKRFQSAVRNLIFKSGFSVQEMRHAKKYTLCCGEGGSVGLTDPTFSQNWTRLREKERDNLPMITYCAGCSEALSRTAPTKHVLDLVFGSAEKSNQNADASSAPFTYLHRLRLKHHFQKTLMEKRN